MKALSLKSSCLQKSEGRSNGGKEGKCSLVTLTRAVVKLESIYASLELTKEVWASPKGDRWRTKDGLRGEGAGFME